MRLSLPIILSLLLFAWPAANAQSADDFFNTGAQFYISNNIANAKQVVEGGLKRYPDDVKLKKLEELLKQQSQQQQQQQQQQNRNQQQQNQQNQQQSQPNQGQSQNQPSPSQPQNQDSAQNQSGQQKEDQQSKQPQPSSGQPNDKKDGQDGQAQASATREMSPEEARRLLDAQKGDEQFLQLKPKTPPERQNKPIKDW